MKYIYALLLALIAGCKSQQDEPSVAFTSVTVIDAVNGPRENQTVIVSGKKIVKVGQTQEVDLPSSAMVIDGGGKYLIPGLWDAHVHLSYEADLSPAMFSLFLVNGITSIRDTGGQLDLVMPWKKTSLTDDGTSPRVMVTGPLLDGVPTVYDGKGSRPRLGLGAGTPENAATLVEEFVNRGVDLIKSYEMLTPEAFAKVIEKAKSHDKVVTGHVPLSMDVIEASNLGMRSMEHMRNLEMSCSEDFDSLLQVRRKLLADGADQAGGDLRSSIHSAQRFHSVKTQNAERRESVLSALAKNNTWQVPTMTIVTAMENRVFDRKAWIDDFRFLPNSVQKRWAEGAATMSQKPTPEANVAFATWAFDMVKRIDDEGIGIMAGTDTPIFFLTPGFSLHEELRLLVKSGLTPIKALEAATIRPAQYFNIEAELGTIESGKFADLILLDANPLHDITNTQKINSVMKSGKLYNRGDLDNMLQQLEKQ